MALSFDTKLQTIALIAVKEGVLQLGSVNKVYCLIYLNTDNINVLLFICMYSKFVSSSTKHLLVVFQVTEDLNYITILQKKFTQLLSIPGFLLPHPSLSSSSSLPSKINCSKEDNMSNTCPLHAAFPPLTMMNFYDHSNHPMVITPSMSSLEALLSKLPSVVPTPSTVPLTGYHDIPPRLISIQKPLELDFEVVAMEINERKEQ